MWKRAAQLGRRFRALHGTPRASTWAEDLGVTGILPGFQVDEYVFAPTGYSLNALRDQHYYTVHVTTERPGSYVSFETNCLDDAEHTVACVLEIFRPTTWDTALFSPADQPYQLRSRSPLRRCVRQTLACGYVVELCLHHSRQRAPDAAFEIAP